jgi:hypothetical protein
MLLHLLVQTKTICALNREHSPFLRMPGNEVSFISGGWFDLLYPAHVFSGEELLQTWDIPSTLGEKEISNPSISASSLIRSRSMVRRASDPGVTPDPNICAIAHPPDNSSLQEL